MTATDDFHMRKVEELIKENCQIIQRETDIKLGISQDHMHHIIYVLQYWNVYIR